MAGLVVSAVENTKVIDATGQYIAPGFMDAHIHVESAMVTVREYARAVVPHGTTGIFMEIGRAHV